ncbi:hypothetical protein AVEN_53526-1 [Araneus ventricosus]|uniref:Ribosomal RNA methyltransferase FtsJ domain-containing protein n=1 Tax=Araneus ventricosus TaxID=182803 RepID=A0A4Y2PNE2_ARAVE|nr:hypothetical protein AVEN_53526-1 [Araneus ventricosus]
MDEKYTILKPGDAVVDCGAAPGSWTQVIVNKLKLDKETAGVGKPGVYGAGLLLANSSWRNFMCRRQILFWLCSTLFIAFLRMRHLKMRD